MLLKKALRSLSCVVLLSSLSSFSYAEQAKPALDKDALTLKIGALLGLEVKSVKPSPMENLLEVITNQGIFYTSADGEFLVHGKLYGIGENVTNYTEEALAKLRVEGIEQFKGDFIVYPAKNEKFTVTIFTDITCGYCRQLHQQMDEYNKLGITVRYLPYPRAGVKDNRGQLTDGFKDLRSIWCHEDPAKALTKAKAGSSVAQRICDKPLEQEFDFARQVGVNSTPAIVFDNGFMLPGYRQPQDLLKILQSLAEES